MKKSSFEWARVLFFFSFFLQCCWILCTEYHGTLAFGVQSIGHLSAMERAPSMLLSQHDRASSGTLDNSQKTLKEEIFAFYCGYKSLLRG